MKALVTAFALLSFVAASTIPVVSYAQTAKTDAAAPMKKKAPAKKKMAKKTATKKAAKPAVKKPS